MQFGLSEEQSLLADSVSRFLADHSTLDDVRKIAAGDANDADIWQGLVTLGISGLLIEEGNGGVGLGSLEAAVVAELLGYRATPAPFIGAAMASRALEGSPRDDLLGDVGAGNCRVGIAFSEAIGARDDAGMSVDSGKISGKSIFAIDADADFYLVATSGGAMHLVDRQHVTVTPHPTIDRTRTVATLEFDSAPAASLESDNARFERVLDTGRLVLAADTLGAAQNMIDQAVDYAKQREQFNRPIASFQAVKHMCAEMAADLEPCRSLVWYAAHALDHVPEEAHVTVCHAKAHLAEVGKQIAKMATEVHGGMGFTDLVGLHYWFKRIGFNRQMLGAPELVREEAARAQGLAA